MSPATLRALAQVFGVKIPDFDRAFENLYTPFNTLVVDLGRAAGQSSAGDVYPSVGGDFIYVDPDQSTLNGAIGSVTIELNDQTNADKAAFTANPGFALNAVFTSLKLRYTNQPGKRLVLKYSTGYSVIPSFAALTSIANQVSVNPLLDSVTASGVAFMDQTDEAGNVGNLSHVQCWNPGGGKIVYVDGVDITALSVAGTFEIRWNNAAILADVKSLANINAPGAVSQARIRQGNIAAVFGNTIKKVGCLVNTTQYVQFNPPIRVPANFGVHVNQVQVNTQINVGWNIRELGA